MTHRQDCCEDMANAIECSLPGSEFSNPDALIHYNSKFDEYGLFVRDGGTSFVEIRYCPWCGRTLPSSRRDDWFERLEKMGIDPWKGDVPAEFETDKWYRGDEGQ